MLSWCSTCKEHSILTKLITRKKDKKRMLFEKCLNANPMCRYQAYREIKNYEDQTQKKVHENQAQKEKQLEFWGSDFS